MDGFSIVKINGHSMLFYPQSYTKPQKNRRFVKPRCAHLLVAFTAKSIKGIKGIKIFLNLLRNTTSPDTHDNPPQYKGALVFVCAANEVTADNLGAIHCYPLQHITPLI
jgi:hypothetical protein